MRVMILLFIAMAILPICDSKPKQIIGKSRRAKRTSDDDEMLMQKIGNGYLVTGAHLKACSKTACGKISSFQIATHENSTLSCHERFLGIAVPSGDTVYASYLSAEHDCLQDKQETIEECPRVKR